MKYARIIKIFAEKARLSYEDALGRFYDSETYILLSEGIADMHCRSDEYLADELLIEYGYKKGMCQNRHIPLFMRKAPTFSSQGFVIS